MRRKIREIMNKEEGFTLVELLAVLAILAIIVAIAVPAIGNVIGKSQKKATKASEEMVVDAARLYDIEETEGLGSVEEFVTVGYLVKQGYLDIDNSEDSSTGIEDSHGVHIERVTNGGTKYKFEKTAPNNLTPKTE